MNLTKKITAIILVLMVSAQLAFAVQPVATEARKLHLKNLTADKFVQELADEALALIKSDADIRNGDVEKINKIANELYMPYTDFRRITAAAVGPKWRSATEQQRGLLVSEFQQLLTKTYVAGLKQVDKQIIKVLPLAKRDVGKDRVTVKSQLITPGKNPINIDYRVIKAPHGWMVYDINAAGIWFTETYRQQFATTINSTGIAGLIKELHAKNEAKIIKKPDAAVKK